MKCHHCQEQDAAVQVIDLPKGALAAAPPDAAPECSVLLVCDDCARALKLPIHGPAGHKKLVDIVQLLKHSAGKAHKDSSLACPHCGITLNEFRTKGRLGCPNDYEVFAPHLERLLRSVHNATRHVGRVPGLDEDTLRRKSKLTDLRAQLELAIREEQYENAARLRDEIQSMEREEPEARKA